MRIHVVTFANSAMSHMHKRFLRQARELGVFSTVHCWTQKNLDASFRDAFADVLRPEVRGFGYFVWKPQVILQALELIEPGDVLLYLDSGSHLVAGGRERFMDYVRVVEASESGILAFQLSHIEKEWSKGDLLDYFSVRAASEIVDTPQIQAGAIFVHFRRGVDEFFRAWLDVFSRRFDLVDDTPSRSPNERGFVTHRHDQSVFSILAKQWNVSLLSALEQYPPGDPPAWDTLRDFPIHHRRDKRSRVRKLIDHLVETRRRLEALLMRVKKRVFPSQ